MQDQDKTLKVRTPQEMAAEATAIPDVASFRGALTAIAEFQKIVRSEFIEDVDFGIIPGTPKPSLLKPGAEKIAKILQLADEYIIMDAVRDWEKGFFHYEVKCQLRHLGTGLVVAEGMGECNSLEGKYHWRETKRKCPTCGKEAIIKGKKDYGGGWLCFKKIGGCGATWGDGAAIIEKQQIGRVVNDDIYTSVNTFLKMAKKRAEVDASLSAGRLSNLFTQDIEDAVEHRIDEDAMAEEAAKAIAAKNKGEKKAAAKNADAITKAPPAAEPPTAEKATTAQTPAQEPPTATPPTTAAAATETKAQPPASTEKTWQERGLADPQSLAPRHMGDVRNFATKYFPKLKPATFLSILGVKRLEEITNTPMECWQIILAQAPEATK